MGLRSLPIGRTPSKDQPHGAEPFGSGQLRKYFRRDRTVKPQVDTDYRRDPRRSGQRSLSAAEGVLVALLHCSLDEAFADIVQTAKRHSVAPLELADALVAIAENDVTANLDGALTAAVDRAWGTLLASGPSNDCDCNRAVAAGDGNASEGQLMGFEP
jgi:hypothetical protein